MSGIIQKDRKPENKEYAKIGFGVTLLLILVIGIFRPAILSGIPLLFALVTFLGGLNVFAGITGLILAVGANILYIFWWLDGFVRGRSEDEEFDTSLN